GPVELERKAYGDGAEYLEIERRQLRPRAGDVDEGERRLGTVGGRKGVAGAGAAGGIELPLVARVADAVAGAVFLSRIADRGAVVAGIGDSVAVAVHGIRVARVTHAIVVAVALAGIGHGRAVVDRVATAIAIPIAGTEPDTGIAGIAEPVEVRVG